MANFLGAFAMANEDAYYKTQGGGYVQRSAMLGQSNFTA
jgi:hypothetical protein